MEGLGSKNTNEKGFGFLINLDKGSTMAQFFEIIKPDSPEEMAFWKILREHVDFTGSALYEELQREGSEEAKKITVFEFLTEKLGLNEDDIEKIFPIKFN